MKDPLQIGREAVAAMYGTGTVFEEPNADGVEGLDRAIAEHEITGFDADSVLEIISRAIAKDRQQISDALNRRDPIPGIRAERIPEVSELVDAYERFDGDVEFFVHQWNDHILGIDFPCPGSDSGTHGVTEGSCNGCGSKNRN